MSNETYTLSADGSTYSTLRDAMRAAAGIAGEVEIHYMHPYWPPGYTVVIVRDGATTWSDISGLDLRNADLRDLDLRGTRAVETDFRDADLSGSDLSRAVIRETDFTRADLRGVNFRDANIRAVEFIDADLRDTDFTGAVLRRVDDDVAKTSGRVGWRR